MNERDQAQQKHHVIEQGIKDRIAEETLRDAQIAGPGMHGEAAAARSRIKDLATQRPEAFPRDFLRDLEDASPAGQKRIDDENDAWAEQMRERHEAGQRRNKARKEWNHDAEMLTHQGEHFQDLHEHQQAQETKTEQRRSSAWLQQKTREFEREQKGRPQQEAEQSIRLSLA